MRYNFLAFFLLFSFVSGCGDKKDNSQTNQAGDEVNSSGMNFKLLDSKKTGITFLNNLEQTEEENIFDDIYFFNGSGVAVGDVNNDGLPDLYFGGNQTSNKLYINKGNFQFEDVTEKAGVSTSGWTTGVAMADVNNDGWLDIYVCRTSPYVSDEDRTNLLFINKKGAGFEESGALYGLDNNGFSTQASFFDADNDGDLDMYLANRPLMYKGIYRETYKKYRFTDELGTHRMFLNEGGKFKDISEKADVLCNGYGLSANLADFNQDGITDIYGVLYKPFDMDTTKVYPLLEYVYPGPQTEAVNKSFSYRMDRLDRMAQVGFVVITLGNRGGHPDRSKWYHNYGYGNLRDYGLADKKYVAQQLANRHDYIDIEKVGIYGHSGGGFMSTAAMLVYPDFFKAAVSSAGNHDNNVYNSWWSETHHGVKEEIDEKGKISHKYKIDNNQSLAKNLKGHLMLIHGDMDNNVHPAGTIRMANELIKAHKRFKFMIMPGQRHGFGSMTEYSFWLRADHFSKYLLGEENMDVDFMFMNMDQPKNR